MLRRVDDTGTSNTTTALPNALVVIDEAGNVTRLMDLPAGRISVTVNVDAIFSSGFEE